VVGVFPNDAAQLRLAGSLLIEQNDEWLVSRRYLSETSMAELTTHPTPTTGNECRTRVDVSSGPGVNRSGWLLSLAVQRESILGSGGRLVAELGAS
jgi:hypothetical protein